MGQLLVVLLPIALLDATSITPLCMVPLILLMSGERPVVTAGSFLIGIFVSYLLCSAFVLLGLQSLIDLVAARVLKMWNHPDTLDIWLGIAIGLAMVFFGARLERSRESKDESRVSAGATPLQAFSGGFALTIIGLPGALPLFAAVDQILRADPGVAGQAVALVFYNTVFVAPLTLLFVMRVALGDRIEPLMRRISEVMTTGGRRGIVVALIVGGLVLAVDGVGWLLGSPLLPTFPEPAP